MANGRHTESRFLAISRRHIGRSTRNLEQRWRITCRYRSRYQNCNVHKFKMADGRHFEKIALSSYLSRELTDFDQIRYTYTNFHSEHGHLTTTKSKFLKFKMADGRLSVSTKHVNTALKITLMFSLGTSLTTPGQYRQFRCVGVTWYFKGYWERSGTAINHRRL